jgi:hypothetical protein
MVSVVNYEVNTSGRCLTFDSQGPDAAHRVEIFAVAELRSPRGRYHLRLALDPSDHLRAQETPETPAHAEH